MVLLDIVDDFSDWWVASFKVSDLPQTLPYLGQPNYFSFKVSHVPLDWNYPHSEIWLMRNGVHIQGKAKLPPEVHLQFRNQLRMRMKAWLPVSRP